MPLIMGNVSQYYLSTVTTAITVPNVFIIKKTQAVLAIKEEKKKETKRGRDRGKNRRRGSSVGGTAFHTVIFICNCKQQVPGTRVILFSLRTEAKRRRGG